MIEGPAHAGLLSATLRLFTHVSRRRRLQFYMLLGLTLVGSVAEALSLGAVLPFIGVLTQPQRVFESPSLARVVHVLGITSPAQLIVPLTIAFAAAALIAGVLRLLILYVSTMLSNGTGADLGIAVYRQTLYQPYTVHVSRSSSEIISGLTQKVTTAASVLMSLVTVVTSALLFLAILGTLLVIDPRIATIAAVGFGVAYAALAWLTRHRLRQNSLAIAREQTTVVKTLQEGLGAIRDVLLDGTQAVYTTLYGRAVRQLQRATAENSFITLAPRFAMETLAVVMVAVLAYSVSHRTGDVAAILPVLAALAVGAQRLLPLLQQLYANWSLVAGSHGALADVLDLLDQPVPEHAAKPEPVPLTLRDGIAFENVSFRYESRGPLVLDSVNLFIAKGARVGLFGTTGSGKSTALDLLMCLLQPTQGRILVDGRPIGPEDRRAWQRNISHVPQAIFVADATIAENIAFGVPLSEIDQWRVRQAADWARLNDVIAGRSEGYQTVVGEGGIRLSGGQRQRIGIARALYKQASVLVLDEATSALDSATEFTVMEAIQRLDRQLTVLIVAHRLTTLERCDNIVRLERGRVVAQGSYADVIGHAPHEGALLLPQS